jgi:hypothetical protein
LATHDTNPRIHVQGWITTPPAFCQAIAARAAEIQEKYGDQLDVERPKIAALFADELENLEGFTMPIFSTFGHIDSPGMRSDRQFSRIRGVVDQGWGGFSNQLMLSRLGIIPTGLNAAQAERAERLVRASYASHIAELLLNLEEVKPLPDDSKRRRDARIRLLSKVANLEQDYAAAA